MSALVSSTRNAGGDEERSVLRRGEGSRVDRVCGRGYCSCRKHNCCRHSQPQLPHSSVSSACRRSSGSASPRLGAVRLRPEDLEALTSRDAKRGVAAHFGRLPLLAIMPQEVDRFRHREGVRGRAVATYINSMLTRLAQILELGVEYGYLDRNPARGRNRRLKQSRHRGTFLDDAASIEALLAAAGKLDRAGRTKPYRRALGAVLVFAGLRIDEALSLRWRDVNLPSRTLKVGQAKTDAGARPRSLTSCSTRAAAPPATSVATATGGKLSPRTSVTGYSLPPWRSPTRRSRRGGGAPAAAGAVTPTRCAARLSPCCSHWRAGSVRDGAGRDTDPKVTLGIYARVMRRSDEDTRRLHALVDGAAVSAGNGVNEALAIP